jgi:hypothetical protein
MVYRTKAHHFYKPNPEFARTRTFWKVYRTIKMIIGIIYDASSVILVLMSFDKVYKFKSWRVVKPWQIAMLVQKVPKLVRSLRHHLTYGI